MLRTPLTLLLLTWSTLYPLCAVAAFVDTITVKDGSILKGEIKRVENDELILDTEYADDVVIEVEYITEIDTTQHFTMRLLDGEKISGYITVREGHIVLREETAPFRDPRSRAAPEVDSAETEAAPTPPETEVTGEAIALAESEVEAAEATALSAPPEVESGKTIDVPAPPDLDPDDDDLVVEASPSGDDGQEPPAEETEDDDASAPMVVARADDRVFGFDDVDWIREKPTYLRYNAEFSVGAQSASGNTETTDIHLDGLFAPTFGWNTLRFRGKYDFQEADNETTEDRWLASLEYKRDIGRRWFIGAANSYEGDGQRDLDLRIIAAAGVGYRFYDNDPTWLTVLPAIAYVFESFDDPDDDKNYAAFRWTGDFKRDLYKDDITFFHNHKYLNSLQDIDDIIIETNTGIEFDLAWDLKLKAEFQTLWDNRPAEDNDKTDTRWILSIGYEFEGDEEDWFH